MAQYYERETLLKAICRGCNEEFSDAPCEPSECLLLREIQILPTADVVPKSEVEALLKENARWLMEYANQRAEVNSIIEKAKQEVAREIFEEFERLMENNEVYFCQTDEMREEFAKLKKKYTEGEG